jgi:hypothetical protein
MRIRTIGQAWIALGLLFCVTLMPLQSVAYAQTSRGRIIVTVQDESGAIIPGATVRIVNDGTLEENSGVTTDAGLYTYNQAPVATYTVTVEAQGFQTKVVQAVKVDVSQDYSLTVSMVPGGIGETVTVTAGEDLVQTSTTDVTNTVNPRQVQDLPLNGRNPLSLVNLQAGTNANGRTNTAINGQRVSSVDVRQDGINIQDNFIRAGGFEVTATRPTVAQVAEFSVTTSNAQVDAAGASTVRLVTPSGTSELHGSVFEFHRNDAVGANEFFNNAQDVEREKLIRNQFGFTLGGPIYIPKVLEQRDKLFFFGFYEGLRQRAGGRSQALTFTPEAVAGVFRYRDANTGQIRSVDILDIGGFDRDPIAAGILAQLPPGNDPTIGDTLNTIGYSFNKNNYFDRNQGGARIDYNINERHRLEAIYTYTGDELSRTDIDTTFRVNPAAAQAAYSHFGVAAWNWNITDTLVNEVRVGTVNSTVPFFLTEERNLSFIPVLPLVTDPILDTGQIAPQGRRTITSSLIDNAAYSWGQHFFRFGGELQDIRVRSYSSFGLLPTVNLGFSTAAPSGSRLVFGDFPGTISSADLSTANGLLAALAGIVANANQTYQATSQTSGYVPGAQEVRNFRVRNYSLYGADQWRIHPRVTLNLGVRWDYTTPLREIDNLALLPVIQPGQTAVDAVLDPNGFYDFADGYYFNPDRNNFAPNVGVAWDIFGDGRTVLRGGYSIAYINDEAIRSFDNAAVGNDGLSQGVAANALFGTLSGGNFNGAPTSSVGDLLFASLQPGEFMVPRSYLDNFNLDPASAAFLIDPDFQTPYYHQWNISLEREIGWDTAVSLRYVGNRSRNLAQGVDYNQLDVISNGFAADVARARQNGLLALQRNGVFDPRFNPDIPGSQQLTVFPLLPLGGLLTNATIQSFIITGEAGTLAQVYVTNFLNGDIPFRANPSIFVADVLESRATSDYHAFQAEVRRRFAAGFGFQANYTWSKALVSTSGLTQQKFEPPIDINNPLLQRSRAEYDIPHAFKANVIYELPFGKGKPWADYSNSFASALISGWQISSIFEFQTGSPFSILSARGTFNRVGRSPLNGANTSLTRDEIEDLFGIFENERGIFFINPSVIGPDGRGAAPDTVGSFAGQVFFNPGSGEIGGLQPFQFNGPNAFSWDAGIIKRTPIPVLGEAGEFEFRVEFFNVLNHPVFFVGNQNINSTTFGRITSTVSAPRVIQFAGKINF